MKFVYFYFISFIYVLRNLKKNLNCYINSIYFLEKNAPAFDETLKTIYED